MTDVPGVIDTRLAQGWREVYRRAAEVAEERTIAHLREHVYRYPHGAGAGGGGGGGGGWVLVYEHQVTATSETTLRLPASGTLPQTHGSLVVEVRGRSTATGTSRDNITMQVNATSTYNYAFTLTRNDVGTLTGFASTFDNAWDVGAMPRSGAPAGHCGYTTIHLPMYTLTGSRKGYLARSETTQGTSDTNPYLQESGGWVIGTTDAITVLFLQPGTGTFAQGTLVRVWGVTGDGGGGGGGSTDVTITSDASLTVAESPDNTFALAAQLSVDSGNALSLHSNGLFASGGGGGTGNTTMYTQTTSPTGATNSLWFNPSESA